MQAAGCCRTCSSEGTRIGRLHVATPTKRMPIESIYRRPNTSKPVPGHKIDPYLLRKLAIVRPDQVWATNITYIPMAKGFVYLVAIVDWFSHKVLAREADFGGCRSRWRPIPITNVSAAQLFAAYFFVRGCNQPKSCGE